MLPWTSSIKRENVSIHFNNLQSWVYYLSCKWHRGTWCHIIHSIFHFYEIFVNGTASVKMSKWRHMGSSFVVFVPGIRTHVVNSLRPRQKGRQFPDDIFKCIFLTENVIISIKISLKFVPKGSMNNILTLLQIMAWRRPGDKPLSEPMMVRLSTHICVTRPQWVIALDTGLPPETGLESRPWYKWVSRIIIEIFFRVYIPLGIISGKVMIIQMWQMSILGINNMNQAHSNVKKKNKSALKHLIYINHTPLSYRHTQRRGTKKPICTMGDIRRISKRRNKWLLCRCMTAELVDCVFTGAASHVSDGTWLWNRMPSAQASQGTRRL